MAISKNKLSSEKSFMEDMLNNAKTSSIIDYKASYAFLDAENRQVLPFRLIMPKNASNAPLVVYLCGSASVGRDNVKNLAEFLIKIGHKALDEVNVLIPQPTYALYDAFLKNDRTTFDSYIKSLYSLIDYVKNEFDLCDKTYLASTSLGSFCAWRLMYLYPNCANAAVITVGGFDMASNFRIIDHDFSRYASTPIWLAHSSNDKSVSVDMDDYAYDKLKALSAEIKYTRTDNFGHQLSTVFFRKENWLSWLLEH